MGGKDACAPPTEPCGIDVDSSANRSLQWRYFPRSVLLTSAVANQEHTYEAQSNLPILASARDVSPPDPRPFSGEASAPDPRLISCPGRKHLSVLPMVQAVPALQHQRSCGSPRRADGRIYPRAPQHDPAADDAGQPCRVLADVAVMPALGRRGGATASGGDRPVQAHLLDQNQIIALEENPRHSLPFLQAAQTWVRGYEHLYGFKIGFATTWQDRP
jgi:hypothetical protein